MNCMVLGFQGKCGIVGKTVWKHFTVLNTHILLHDAQKQKHKKVKHTFSCIYTVLYLAAPNKDYAHVYN